MVLTANKNINKKQIHDKWGGDIGRAVVGGAITGLAVGIGVNGGEYLGNLAGSAVGGTTATATTATASATTTAVVGATTTVATTTATTAATTATTTTLLGVVTTAATKAAVVSFTNTIGSAMSQTAIYGGDLGDVLEAGGKSMISEDTWKGVAISAGIGGVGAALGEWIKDVKSNYNASLTEQQKALNMTEISVEESNLKPGSYFDSKVGVNSYIENGKIIQAGTGGETAEVIGNSNKLLNVFSGSNQNPIFKTLNLLPGSPSFADFHDALNLLQPWNALTIIPAYPISQFNAIYPYYPVIINQPRSSER